MAKKMKEGCVKPAAGPMVAKPADEESNRPTGAKEEMRMQARVGREAIDFEANAYVEGKGFVPVKLSSHKGKWIVLCFYPGDFTFV